LAETSSLADAIAELLRDGDSIALEGFTHLIPFEPGHEVLRQCGKELELIRSCDPALQRRRRG
jgi:glutaconate CoA-transferase, subunit A